MNTMLVFFDVLFDIDVQGGHQIRAARPEARLILILPPSWDELERRLRDRGTDSDAVIEARLRAAEAEVRASMDYDEWVVNDDLGIALRNVRGILRGEPAFEGGQAALQLLVNAP